jgi:hypothetical protein
LTETHSLGNKVQTFGIEVRLIAENNRELLE